MESVCLGCLFWMFMNVSWKLQSVQYLPSKYSKIASDGKKYLNPSKGKTGIMMNRK